MTVPDSPETNAYDEMPYLSTAFRSTNPDSLATLARLVGIQAAPVERCRVLEMGCSDGGNLIPMAYAWPGSEFVGLDLSARQIQMGVETIGQLGLTNIRLEQLNLMDVGEQYGRFDYIVAHGIYSWVPPDVQEKILSICESLLTDNGIACISYNTLPGWHMRGMAREAMLYHVRNIGDPVEKVRAARSFLGFLAEQSGQAQVANLTATDLPAYATSLLYEHNMLGQFKDSYVYHEHLEPVNEAIYFTEFIRRAGGHGLQYLTEADFFSAQLVNFPAAVGERIRGMSTDIVETQQYMDFVSNRTFRQTVLCRDALKLNRSAMAEVMSSYYVAAFFRAASETPDLTSSKDETFTSYTGKTLTIGAPIVKAALMCMSSRWPEYLSFGAVMTAAHELLEPNGPHVYTAERLAEETQVLGTALLHCFAQGAAELHVTPAPFASQLSSRPKVSLLARLQAQAGNQVTNLRHETLQLDDISRHIIRYLDGEHDQAQLFNHMADLVRQGTLVIEPPAGGAGQSEEGMNRQLVDALQQSLQRLVSSGLMIG